MSIKIEVGSKPAINTFGQLSNEQPFIDTQGFLCIKSGGSEAIILASPEGSTQTGNTYLSPCDEIKKALPMIKRWGFK